MNTPLHLSVINSSHECIEILLTFHPNVVMQNKEGKTAIDLTSSSKILKLFEDYYSRSKTPIMQMSPKMSPKIMLNRRKVSPHHEKLE